MLGVALLAVVLLAGFGLVSLGAGRASGDDPGRPAAAPQSAAPLREPGDRSEQVTEPSATAATPLVTFIGDSWTDGAGATGRVGYAHLTGRLLGWEHRVLGVGGSGYVRGGDANVPFSARIRPALAGNPDVVVVQGSINERRTPSAVLAGAVAETLGRLSRAAGSDTAVVVLGASHVPAAGDAQLDRVNDVLRAEAARLDLPFVDVAAENWSDPDDPSIWADDLHVNDAGARQIARRLVPVLEAVVVG